MSEVLCPQCQAVNRDTARFCSECGEPLPGGASQAMGPTAAPGQSTGVQPSTSQASAPEPADTQPGPVELPSLVDQVLLNRYRIQKELGRGGFGAVYKAWDVNLSRRCALKENLDTSTEAQRQFAREATVLANLSHPNLPRVTDHFSIPGQGQYLVMDFVEGEDLATVVYREKQVAVDKAVDWISQVADALAYLHNRQPPVLHRDIKPANIRITPEGKAMLVDFGLVKMADPTLKTTLGARAVTPGYAPPEQYGMGRTDARSDIYALSATLYKLLTGDEPMESVQRVTGGKMTPTCDLNPKVPVIISQAIEKAMLLDPAQRFQNVTAFKSAVQSGLGTPLAGAGRRDDVHGPTGTVLVSPGSARPVASPAVSAPAGAGTAGVPQRPGGARPAMPPANPSRMPGGASAAAPSARPMPLPDEETAAKTRSPWLWIGLGGVAIVILLCLVSGGGLLAYFGSGDASPTPAATTTATTSNQGGVGSPTPQADVSPVAPGETPVVVEQPTHTPPPPTAEPSPTADARFRSPDSSKYVFADFGFPDTLDPSYNYETSGLAVAQNIYDTLIFFNREHADQFVPQLALEVPSVENGLVSADGLAYTFRIRPNVRFHDGSPLTVEDVAYTFQRGLLQGGTQTPQWLLAEPLLGTGIYDVAALVDPALQDLPADLKNADPGRLLAACQQVQNAIVADPNAGTVTFRLKQPWSPFLASLANAWGGIRSKAWTIANGGWDGNCQTWQNFYGRTAQELNQTGVGNNAMGTGPYKFDHWNEQELVLQANEDYWRQEPAWPGGPVGAPAIKTVVVDFTNFDQALEMLKKGEADSLNTDTAVNWPTLDAITGLECTPTDLHCTPTQNPDAPLERVVRVPLGSRPYDINFNWQMNAQGGNSLIGSGRLDGSGVPPDFFSNVHVRRAFAYCFNYDRFLNEALGGQGIRSNNVMLPNMLGYDASSPYYTYNPDRCADEFRQAQFDGRSVWDTGLRLVLPFPSGDAARRLIAEIFRDELGRLNQKFRLEARQVQQQEYNTLNRDGKLPYANSSWIEDIHDPHNWVYPYTLGNLARGQHIPADLQRQFQDIISRAVTILDPAGRAEVYREFNQRYYEEAPAILLFQMVGRHYQQRWVNGWYGNPVLPGLYYYMLSKY